MEKYKKFASEITDNLNSFSFDQNAFNQSMNSEHRTLQQNFTRMCLGWLEHCASEEYKDRADARNIESHNISVELIKGFRKHVEEQGYTGSTLDLMSKPSGYLGTI
jgi:hypothetical protein